MDRARRVSFHSWTAFPQTRLNFLGYVRGNYARAHLHQEPNPATYELDPRFVAERFNRVQAFLRSIPAVEKKVLNKVKGEQDRHRARENEKRVDREAGGSAKRKREPATPTRDSREDRSEKYRDSREKAASSHRSHATSREETHKRRKTAHQKETNRPRPSTRQELPRSRVAEDDEWTSESCRYNSYDRNKENETEKNEHNQRQEPRWEMVDCASARQSNRRSGNRRETQPARNGENRPERIPSKEGTARQGNNLNGASRPGWLDAEKRAIMERLRKEKEQADMKNERKLDTTASEREIILDLDVVPTLRKPKGTPQGAKVADSEPVISLDIAPPIRRKQTARKSTGVIEGCAKGDDGIVVIDLDVVPLRGRNVWK